jgi:polyisoprenoid-binding protein YceI
MDAIRQSKTGKYGPDMRRFFMLRRIRVSKLSSISRAASLSLAAALLIATLSTGSAQAPRGGPGGAQPQGPPPPPPTAGAHLDIADGSSASYRVTEQFVGIDFPNDAIGSSTAISGSVTIAKDGSVTPDSKLTVDLTKLTSDQDMRDNFIRTRVLDTATYPNAVFVPTRIEGLPAMIPFTGQSGVKLTGNLTVHGVTKEVTFQGIATFNRDGTIAGRIKTSFPFGTFGLTKPSIARLANVEDKIDLDIAFRFKRS